jgi:hypothetical protein
MSAIDMHAHAFPDQIAERAIAKLEAECPWRAVGPGTIDALLASMDDADIDVSVVCAIATRPDQNKGILKWCRQIRSDRIEPFPSVHPRTKQAGKWVQRIAEAEFAGIKLHPMYQETPVDAPEMDDIYAAAAEHGLLVAPHCGFDIAYPMDDDRASPARLRRVIDRFPELKMICTHMGGWEAWDAVEAELLGTGVLLETSCSLDRLDPRRAVDMIRRHGVDRIVYGSDWPWNTQTKEADLIRKLGLSKRETRRILWSNAAKLLGY